MEDLRVQSTLLYYFFLVTCSAYTQMSYTEGIILFQHYKSFVIFTLAHNFSQFFSFYNKIRHRALSPYYVNSTLCPKLITVIIHDNNIISWYSTSVFHYLVARYVNGSGYDTCMILDFCAVTITHNVSCGCIFCQLHSNMTISYKVQVFQLQNIQWFIQDDIGGV